MKPDPVEIEARNVSAARRRKIIEKQDGICKRAGCEEPATDVDHIVPLWCGGSNRDDNLEGLCAPHHRQKTSAEAKVRGKVKRIEKRIKGERKPRKPIPNRGFDKPPEGYKHQWGKRTFPKKGD
jgi:5-methylcytosine-specific restriction enzyme A